jgi:paired amphipathic helix protein Sin3a
MTCPTTQDQINSRRNAEKVLGPDENLFRIDWVSRTLAVALPRHLHVPQLPDSKTLAVQLIGKDDSSFDDSEVLTGRWQSYIDSFVSVGLYSVASFFDLTRNTQDEHTHGVPASRVKRPFLRK